jgi:hypothetical protein
VFSVPVSYFYGGFVNFLALDVSINKALSTGKGRWALTTDVKAKTTNICR